MGNEGRSLLNAVIANPDDDGPRGIYADWLEEHGEEEYANFIRVQLRYPLCKTWHGKVHRNLSRWYWGCVARQHVPPRVKYCRIANRMTLNVTCMISDHNPYNFQRNTIVVHRGFIDEIRCTVADFMKSCHAIAAEHPVRTWRFTDFEPEAVNLREYHELGVDYGDEAPDRRTYYLARAIPMDQLPDRRSQYLPRELFKYFTRSYLSIIQPPPFAENTSRADLIEDVEQACYHHARSGLSFLAEGVANAK